MMRDKQSRTEQQHSEALAAANAAILRDAARALIRNCDTLQLAHSSARHGGGRRISALLCFDEVQVLNGGRAAALGPPLSPGLTRWWRSTLCGA